MKCPHCSSELTYRQRGGRRCSSCKQEFALEPRTNPLKLHDLRLQHLAAKLSAGGTMLYHADQLRYAAAGKMLANQRPPSVIGCSIVLAIIAAVVSGMVLEQLFTSIVLALIIIGIGFVWRSLVGDELLFPTIPIDAVGFHRDVLERYHKIYGTYPQGLLDAATRGALDPSRPAAANLRGAIVCPVPSVRECLLANQVPDRFGLAVLTAAAPFAPAEIAHLEALKRQPELPILVLHDADPRGCLLPQNILTELGLPEGHRVIDLGLRPQTAIDRKIMTIGDAPPIELIDQLRRQGNLSSEEIDWLMAGNIAPILAVPPLRLLKLIEQAMQRTAAYPAISTPEQAAQAIGFMSWPE